MKGNFSWTFNNSSILVDRGTGGWEVEMEKVSVGEGGNRE